MKNGTIRWVPSDALRASCARGGATLPDILTDGYAGSDELGPYVEFSTIRVSVHESALFGKADLRKLWEAAMTNERPDSN
jgi:hypothetical protein